jgi:hypothetical protein
VVDGNVCFQAAAELASMADMGHQRNIVPGRFAPISLKNSVFYNV